jgi:hypothetical protein
VTFKLIKTPLIFSLFFLYCGSSISSTLTEKRENICGVIVKQDSEIKFEKKIIDKFELKNRVDNERFNACPYKVTMTYKDTAIKIDFNKNKTLQNLNKADSSGEQLDFGAWRYELGSWTLEPDVFGSETKTSVSAVNEVDNGLILVDSATRISGKDPQKCIVLSFIWQQAWAAGIACGSKIDSEDFRKILINDVQFEAH